MNKVVITSIAIILSLIVHFVIFYNYETDNKNFTKEKSQKPTQVKVKFSQTPEKKVKPKKQVQAKPKPKKIKKVKKKKKIEQKKVIKKTVVKKKKIEKKQQNKKKVVKEIKKQQQEVIQKSTAVVAKPKVDNKEELRAKQNKFLTMIKERIDKNKLYPKTAIRRGISGVVSVEFTILPSGEVNGIRILNSKRVFKKATIKAIKNSFPVKIPQELLKEFPKSLSLEIIYTLRDSN